MGLITKCFFKIEICVFEEQESFGRTFIQLFDCFQFRIISKGKKKIVCCYYFFFMFQFFFSLYMNPSELILDMNVEISGIIII